MTREASHDEPVSDASTRVHVRVPSKINLFLSVRGVRDDGYHELVSIMQTVSIHDTVTASFEGAPLACLHPAARRFMELAFSHDAGAGVPDDERNLAVRAARRLMATVGVGAPNGGHPSASTTRSTAAPQTHLHVTKRIPVAAGLAGGSADAAGALLALDRLWGAELEREELRALAGELGADVPFCVAGGTALATGTGTATAQVLTRGTYAWVVCMSARRLPTPQVYQRFDELCSVSEIEPDAVLQALRTGDAEALGAALHNDLEPAAFDLCPELRTARDELVDAGALGALVSGSGPTLLALAESPEHAAELAATVAGHFDRIEVATSPAGGPDLTVDESG